jgi:acetoin utilization deacetylase AcuC-like enzyme
MPLLLITSERFADHETPPGHPERSERAEVMDVIAGRWRAAGGAIAAPVAATTEQLARVHDAEYLTRLAATAGTARSLDQDTYTSPDSHDVALLAAGAAVDAVNRVLAGPSGSRAFAFVRPPGHHAERNRAMGFCLYNNVAVAAAHARAAGLDRIAIVDYDVHHGNGTQHMFEGDDSVLYVSTHQFPFYPGTGAHDEIGTGRGQGFTVNLPLEAGAVDEDYRLIFDRVVLPVLSQYKPQLLLISAGFDAHERDPLGGMRVTAAGFGAMTRELRRVADACCAGRLVAITEGGYDLQALGDSMQAAVEALSADSSAGDWPKPSSVAPRRGTHATELVTRALAGRWKL